MFSYFFSSMSYILSERTLYRQRVSWLNISVSLSSFFYEVHDLIADDVAQGDVALTGTERSQQFFSEMPTDDEFINDCFRA